MCPPLNKILSYINTCAAEIAGTWAELVKIAIPQSIRNNQKPTKILQKRNCKEKINITKPPQCDSAIGLHLLQNKQTVRQQTQ